MRMRAVPPMLLVLLVGLAPLPAPWLQVVLTIALAKGFAVLGIVVLLRAGQVSFGHAMFFAASAYTAAFLARGLGARAVFAAFGARVDVLRLRAGFSPSTGSATGTSAARTASPSRI